MVGNNTQIEKLYKELLDFWNKQDAKGMASLFARDGNIVGFDGSQMNGKMQIESEIKQIFSHHQTASYVGKIREIRFLGPDIVLLRAVAGMVMPGEKDINPEVNAIQSLIAIKEDNAWRISFFQNTPAQFHGRPELAEALTRELQELVLIQINQTMSKGLIAKASITINAPIDKVWDALINPDKIKHYMFGTNAVSDWKEGSPIIWKGEWEGKKYEDRGVIFKLEPGHRIQYSHFSPLTGLPDLPENYHIVTIELSGKGKQTLVFLLQDNNATEEAREHSEKNWKMMLGGLKTFLEK
jgi:uncharacterized protein (TIGR02246 family)